LFRKTPLKAQNDYIFYNLPPLATPMTVSDVGLNHAKPCVEKICYRCWTSRACTNL